MRMKSKIETGAPFAVMVATFQLSMEPSLAPGVRCLRRRYYSGLGLPSLSAPMVVLTIRGVEGAGVAGQTHPRSGLKRDTRKPSSR